MGRVHRKMVVSRDDLIDTLAFGDYRLAQKGSRLPRMAMNSSVQLAMALQ
jgi:hypothetical protein